MIDEILALGFGAALLRSYAPSVFSSLFPIFTPTSLPVKDPSDLTLTPSSTQWKVEKFCPKCKASVSRNEQMAAICNSCGTIYSDIFGFKPRTVRQIWNGSEWVQQENYDNVPANMEIKPLTPAIAKSPAKTVRKTTRVRPNTGPL